MRKRLRMERARQLGVLDFEGNFSPASLMAAAFACRRGVAWKASVQRWMLRGWANAVRLSHEIADGTYRRVPRSPFVICERGKRRLVAPVSFRDRVVERVLCDRVLVPLLGPSMTNDNAAGRAGKGTDFARERFRSALSRAVRCNPGAHVLLYDFADFFGSVPSGRVMNAVTDALMSVAETDGERDDARRTATLLSHFVQDDRGLGIGNQTSQVLAVWWASPVDHWLAEVARVPCGRYMDDGWAVFASRTAAERGLEGVRRVAASLGLTLNMRKTRVVPATSFEVCYLKVVCRASPTGRVRRRVAAQTLRHWKRHARAVARLGARGVIDDAALARSLASRRSLARRCDASTRRRLLATLDREAERLMGCIGSPSWFPEQLARCEG